ncbi:cystatin-like fold lipoprotein [Staphylococcus xylosus]|uniref:Cystatin-like fold lipoprotein n=2 Tax=Staphylococcus xylosus TaxID=1288 RepID=A0AAQ0LYY4_STAXY|nr:cystatin-like fold lipoprotein [Staphylococcus xylosus]MCM3518698.1 DUF4467 domain-containing protein [Staphylococcus xylosus]MCQ3817428.1 cystatin-like fold lipoprotein [Staphylococcus xylosus]MCQ3820131.1 cystatin-like fold lipoprotein [Staphylococcus xylosus]RIM66679.1 cystatin-like fold lipoprotein [Staphylococcus xylosus]RIM92524.1 cystatin-like fold lipoprotein [Staphylococcus xylosus]
MKKIGVLLIMMTVILSACSNNDDKYQKNINKVLDIQKETHKEMAKQNSDVVKEFDKKNTNVYVYKNGKLIIIGYKLFKDKDQIFLATYEFKNDKIYYKRDINPEKYVKEHKADYKKERVK